MRARNKKAPTKFFDREGLSDSLFEKIRSLPFQLSPHQFEKLLDFLSLLYKWNAVYNLTSVREPEAMITQHLLDSLAVVPAFANALSVLDVGAGGGLPGIVLAIALPEMKVALIDTVQKKTAFLNQVKAELSLQNVLVHTGRVEHLSVEQPFDVITSRAFAGLGEMVEWSKHLLASGGQFIAMKGLVPDDEIADLPSDWTVTEIRAVKVPGLSAERHLIFVKVGMG